MICRHHTKPFPCPGGCHVPQPCPAVRTPQPCWPGMDFSVLVSVILLLLCLHQLVKKLCWCSPCPAAPRRSWEGQDGLAPSLFLLSPRGQSPKLPRSGMWSFYRGSSPSLVPASLHPQHQHKHTGELHLSPSAPLCSSGQGTRACSGACATAGPPKRHSCTSGARESRARHWRQAAKHLMEDLGAPLTTEVWKSPKSRARTGFGTPGLSKP